MKQIFLLLLFLSSVTSANEKLQGFFNDYCISCHGPEKQKGKVRFDLDSSQLFQNEELLESLVMVLEDGDMPPKKKKQPAEKLVFETLDLIKSHLEKKEAASTLKRLSREEYTNSINDIFKADFDLSEQLPEDHNESGFNKLGESHIMSPHQMQSYLKTARFVADRLILDEKPEERIWDFSVKNFYGSRRGDYKTEDNLVLTTNYPWRSNIHFSTSDSKYERFIIPEFGRYRFEVEVKIIQSEEDQTIGVNLGDPRYPTNFKKLKRIHLPNKTTGFSVDLTLDKGNQVSFTFDSAKVWRVDGKAKIYKGTKLLFSKVKVIGPIHDEWPTYAEKLIIKKSSEKNTKVLTDRIVRTLKNELLPDADMQELYALADMRQKSGATEKETARTLMTAVLCSPHFIYKKESQSLTDMELAHRMSYFLWNSVPDKELMEAVKQGDLRNEVQRLLSDSKAERFIEDFTSQWLGLDKVDDVSPDERVFKDVTPLQVAAMGEEGKAFFREILNKDLSIENFIDSDFTMLNDQLSDFYGFSKVKGSQFQRVSLPKDSERGGLIGQAGFLKLTSSTFATSPILRGVWILNNMYGEKMEPPSDLVIEEPDIRGAKTIREIMKKHQSTENCFRCHSKIDPLGFALEHYDPIGRWRKEYSNVEVVSKEKVKIEKVKIETNADLPDGREISSMRSLKEVMMNDKEKIIKGIISKLISYSCGKEIGISDRPFVDDVYSKIANENFSLKSAIVEIVSHERFRRK
ncbi:MAG: DUF1592 domain-containing protein [Lentisphaeraceae bacterium]|nr:DUF1592 domain-containing protein [Lentisphaeraceae bacterium]